MDMMSRIKKKHIAICGMDCRLCYAYERKKNGCGGCREVPGSRFASCDRCKIRNCEKALAGNFQFCFSCDSYPCEKIKHIDKRYRTRYSMSMIENLALIKSSGMRKFLEAEEVKWTCPRCGEILRVHKPYCLHCQYEWREPAVK